MKVQIISINYIHTSSREASEVEVVVLLVVVVVVVEK
jgi:hypothetical protein